MSPTLAAVGYSGTPLAQKLGLKDGQRVLFLDLPSELGDLASSRAFGEVTRGNWTQLAALPQRDVVHGFTRSRAVLENAAPALRAAITPDGMVWISWPKRSSKVATDINDNVVREVLLPTGLVDVKVAAIDAVWSGLKFVIRKELR